MSVGSTCVFMLFAPLAAWAAVAMYISGELMTHGKDGPPWFSAQWKADSYTSEGQRWLLRLKRWLIGIPVALFLGVALYSIFCDRTTASDTTAPETPVGRLYVDFATWLIVFVYGAVGFVILWQLVRKRIVRHEFSLRQLFASSSYSAGGQPWLKAFRVWLVGNILLAVFFLERILP